MVADKAVQAYLNDIADLDVMKPEDDGKVDVSTVKGRQALIKANLRYAVGVAKKYQGNGIEMEDLIGLANIGLCRAAGKFEPEKGLRFLTYARWWVHQAILKGLMDAGKIRLPNNVTSDKQKVLKRISKKEQELGRSVDPEEVLGGIPNNSRGAILNPPVVITSMDAPIRHRNNMCLSDVDVTLHELIGSDSDTIDALLQIEYREKIRGAMMGLDPREAEVITRRYGLQGCPEALEEIGDSLSITRERVRQIEKKGMLKLRKHFQVKEKDVSGLLRVVRGGAHAKRS